MSTIQNFKKMNKFANKNRAGLNVAMVILTITALVIMTESPFSSIVSGVITVFIAVILFRAMVKVARK